MPHTLLFILVSGLILLATGNHCYATESGYKTSAKTASKLVAKANAMKLHENPVWRKLLVYEHKKKKPKSQIISNDFFLSDKGHIDPLAELNVTLEGFAAPQTLNPDEHPQCVYRGRFLWLSQQINLEEMGVKEVSCPAFNKWSYEQNISSLSIVYASGFLGNPASYYGHVLLKMNSESNSQSSLEDQALNFGAIIPENENMVVYIVKGILGGYESGFTHREYFYHTHNYGENDLRDMWEYSLNLSTKERDLIVAHAWELLGQKYKYYFLNRNCAYHMAELLEVVTGIDVVPDFPLWSIPQTFIQNIGEETIREKTLVESIKYIPSRQSRFYQKYAELNPQEKKILSDMATSYKIKSNLESKNLDTKSRKRVLQAAADYFQFIIETERRDRDKAKAAHRDALLQLFDMAPGNSFSSTRDPEAPHKGRKPSYASIRLANNSQSEGRTFFRFRPGYYDALDASSGHVAHSNLSMADLELQLDGNDLRISDFRLVHIENVDSRATGLPGDVADYWSLTAQLKQDSLACQSCLVPRLSARKGRSGQALSQLTFAGYLGGGLQHDKRRSGNIFAETGGLAFFELSEKLNFEFRLNYVNYLDESSFSKVQRTIGSRYEVTKDLDLRLIYEKDIAEQFSISIGSYW